MRPRGSFRPDAGGATDAGSPSARAGTQDEGLDREVYVVAGVVILGVIMSIFDTTIVNVALETLSRDLKSPLATIQWVATGYLLALAIMIPLSGWASEHFGAKKVWMVSVGLFGAGSALCGLAWSAESLIGFRVLQGFGGGMIMPVGMSLMTQIAGPHRIGRVMSVIGVPMLLGPILGPVIGGLLVDNASWRWIFYVNIPIVVLALVLAARILHPDSGRADAGRLDWLGLFLLSPGAGLVVFGLSESETHGGFGATIVWGPVVGGLALLAVFVRHALRAERPLIDIRLFRTGPFAAASVTTFLLGGALFGAMIILPLYYQVARGESALTAGLLMAPQGIGAAMVMPLAGRLTDRIGGGRVALVGLIVMTLATVPFGLIGAHWSYVVIAGLLVVRGMGLGATMMPTMAAAYASLTHEAVPRATSAVNIVRQVGASLGTAVLAVVLQHQIATQLPAGRGAGDGTVARLPAAVRERVADPLATAFGHTFWWSVAMSVVAIPAAVVLARMTRNAPTRPGPAAPDEAQTLEHA